MLRKSHLRNVVLCVLVLFCLRVCAKTYIVTDTADSTKITSLRGAIIAANRNGGRNTIILGNLLNFRGHSSQPVYTLSIPLTLSTVNENGSQVGELGITRGDLTIVGMGQNVVIDASLLNNRVFQVFPGARLSLENLTITGGNAGIYGSGAGGAILNQGTLSLMHCLLTENSSGDAVQTVYGTNLDGGDGGAIYNSGQLTMSQCIVEGNLSGAGIANPYTGFGGNGGNGGGIFNSGTMTLDTCIISSNLCGAGANGEFVQLGSFPPGDGLTIISINPFGIIGQPGGYGGNGGGIYNSGQANIKFSTIDDNGSGDGGSASNGNPGGIGASGGNGGGIFNSGALNLGTCTLCQNFCGNGGSGGIGEYNGNGGNGGGGGSGGGIYNDGSLGLKSCTIALNITGAGGNGGDSYTFSMPMFVPPGIGGDGGSGGGIFNGAEANAALGNTLVALNAANTGANGGVNFNVTNYAAVSGMDGFGFDMAGNFTSQGFNWLSTGDGSTGLVNGVQADNVGTDSSPIDPMIGPLQMNGGFTPTCALLPLSPAIDQGNSFGIHTDQRGVHRPRVYSFITQPPGGDGTDIGAYEYNGSLFLSPD